jgi:hypothetical protein
MNKELEKLINLALVDGKITEREKKVLFEKAKELGVNQDEFELILNAKLYKAIHLSRFSRFIKSVKKEINDIFKRRKLEFLGFLIALAAIIISIYEMNKVNQILGNISTSPKNNFPENKDEIHSLVQSAERSLTIVIDQPMYGGFSNPKLFTEFFSDISKKLSLSNFTVKIIFPTKMYRCEMRRKQFNVKNLSINLDSLHDFNFDANNNKIDYRDKLRNFCEFVNNSNVFESAKANEDYKAIKTYADFENLFERNTERFIKWLSLQGNSSFISIDSTATDINANFWLADESRLLFTLISYGNKTNEHTFYSKDKGFIDFAKHSYENLKSLDKR